MTTLGATSMATGAGGRLHVPDGDVRIQKALADAGVASRRAAEALVEAGRVTVNGEPAIIGQRVTLGADGIAVDGRTVVQRPRAVHLALHKPAGVTSTVADRHAEPTVIDLRARGDLRQRAGRIYPVGRLDRDSEGLLLLTNDGDWAQRVLHPSHGVEREYAAGVRACHWSRTRWRLLTRRDARGGRRPGSCRSGARRTPRPGVC